MFLMTGAVLRAGPGPTAPASLQPEQVAALILGVLLAIAGLWLVFTRRREVTGERSRDRSGGDAGAGLGREGRPRAWSESWWPGGLEHPSRAVVGVCMVVVGYHVAFWFGGLRPVTALLPRERWAWLAIGVAVAAGGSFTLDRLALRDGLSRE